MALKHWWKARLMSSGGVHLDSDANTYSVRIMTTPERDPGRVIFTDMSPDVARKMSRELAKAADYAERLNGKMTARASLEMDGKRSARAAGLPWPEASRGLPGSGAARVAGINYGTQVDAADAALFADLGVGDRVNILAGDERGSWGIVRLIDIDGMFHVAVAGGEARIYARHELTK